MFFIFLFKFIFANHKDVDPHRIEIFQEDHPQLFEVIREITKSVGTHFPKKVFLSHNVNAGVFYNSSFLSLFFPVRKNLEIGLGLVNSLNLGELKAILAHEFGHFSQKSMRLGSYVYTVNRVIYNLAYDYDHWDRILEGWAKARGVFGYFAQVTFELAEQARKILRKTYGVVNLQYRGLSREMEFHADEVAALVAGRENTVSALRRSEFCEMAYESTLNIVRMLSEKKQISKNIFRDHSYEIQRIGELFKMEFDHGLPVISDKTIETHTHTPRVIIKDQWATHPSREERENNLISFTQDGAMIDRSESWQLLDNHVNWQEKVTKNLYSVDIGDLTEYEVVGNETYVSTRRSELAKHKADDIFNGYYDQRFFYAIGLDELWDNPVEADMEVELNSVYSKESRRKYALIILTQADLEKLRSIKNNEIKVKYFEFDHKQYSRGEIDGIISKLEEDLKNQVDEFKGIEERAVRLNTAIAGKISPGIKNEYIHKLEMLYEYQNQTIKHQHLLNEAEPYGYKIITRSRWQEGELNHFCRDLSNFEYEYKNFISGLNLQKIDGISKEHCETLDVYFEKDMYYNRVTSFDNERFTRFMDLMADNHNLIENRFKLKLKEITDYQKNMYEKLDLPFAKDRSGA